MTATVVNISVSQEDITNAESGASAYAVLEVPGDYALEITDANDWVNKETKKVQGWTFQLTNLDEPGLGLTFKYFLSFEKERRSKLLRFFEAAGQPLPVGKTPANPNELIGSTLGGRIDWPRKYYTALDADGGTVGDNVKGLGPLYREVRWVFPLTEAPDAVEEEVADVTVEIDDVEVAEVPVLE